MESPDTGWGQFYTLTDLTTALRRQWRTGVACFVVLTIAVAVYVLSAPRVYDGEFKILVKRDRSDPVVSGTPEADRLLNPEVSEAELMSEVEIIQGRDLLEEVAQAVGFVPQSAASQPRGPDASTGKEDEQIDKGVKKLRSGLSVSPIKKTWMINVSYTSEDSRTAKKVLESLSQLYLAKHLAIRRPPGAHQFFAEQSAQAAEELRAARQQLQEFSERNNVVSPSAQRDAVLAKLAEFEGLESQVETSLAETTRRLTALELEKSTTPARRVTQQHTGEAVGLVQELQSKILALELKRTELLQKFTPKYRGVVDLDAQLAQARTALEDARRTTIKDETVDQNPTMQWLENEIVRARTERAALEARAGSLARTVREYRAQAQVLDSEDAEQRGLIRGEKTAEEKYLLYERKQEEARISDALDRTRIANVAIAQSPTVPFEPRLTRGLWQIPIGFVAAFIIAIGVALGKDALDSTIRTPEDLQAAVDLPVLGWVPAGEP